MVPDTLQDEIDAQLKQSGDAKRLRVSSIKLGRGAEDIDLASYVPLDLTLDDHTRWTLNIYSHAVIGRFLADKDAGQLKGIFLSTEPIVIVEDLTPSSVFRGALAYVESMQDSRASSPRRWRWFSGLR